MKRITLGLVALLACLVGFTPARADMAKGTEAGVVVGVVTQWNNKQITIRGVQDEWVLFIDPKTSMMMGHPSVDKEATAWFKRGSNNDMWLTRLYVPQNELYPLGDTLFPGQGQVSGQVKSMDANNLVIRQGNQNWQFAMDGKNTVIVGKPAIDGQATVWYHESNGTMYAKKVVSK